MNFECPHHQRLEAKVDRILLAIEGDDKMGHRGIIPRLSTVEDKQDKMVVQHSAELNQKKGMWAVLKTEKALIGLSLTLGGAIGGGFIEILKLLQNHK